MIAAGLDFGTQSVKLLVFDSERGKTIARASAPLALNAATGGVREQEASWWLEAAAKCFASIPKETRDSIETVGVSGQQHGFVPVAADGSVMGPVKLWCDTSTTGECSLIMERAGGREAVMARAGNAVLPGYTAGKILHFKRARSAEDWKRLRWVMLPHDYINFVLTGEAVMEPGDASGTGLVNIFGNTWDEKLCQAISDDLMEKLPPLADRPSIIGVTCDKAHELFGLRKGIPVSSGGGDNMMAAIGTGAVEEGRLTISLGTSGTLFASSSKPMHDPLGRLASFRSSHGPWLPLLCTMNCTLASEGARKLFGMDREAFENAVSSAPRGSEGVICLPFLNGERVPDLPKGKGCFSGMDVNNMTPANLARAALEGVAFGFRTGIEAMEGLGLKVGRAVLTGGGSKSPAWRRIISEALGIPVVRLAEEESAAFGAALQALWLAGGGDLSAIVDKHVETDPGSAFEPEREAIEAYEEPYMNWTRHVEALGGLWR